MLRSGDNPLSSAEAAQYERDGFLQCRGLLSEESLGPLREAAAEVLAMDGPQRILELDGKTVRSAYGPHLVNAAIRRLCRLPELLGAAGQLIGDDALYLHQSKVNLKAPFVGDAWEWHQDYIYWLLDDGIKQPRLVNAAIYLDEVTEFNGPLTFVPGSHKHGVLSAPQAFDMPVGYEDAPEWVATLTSKEKYGVKYDVIESLVRDSGMSSAKGSAGSVLFFHPNILHASAPNISPFPRTTLILVYNAVGNPPSSATPRPEFLAAREIAPLSSLA
jgi:ectoine hydroxylase